MNSLLEDKVNLLKKSPVYAMSLGSRELFHSNFWAWIMENESYRHKFINFLFPDIDTTKIDFIAREQGNRDLTVWTKDGKAYVIENKFKSLPQIEQLIRYQSNLKDKFQCGIITEIEKPSFQLEKWRFVSYLEIAQQILDIYSLDSNYNHLIYEYGENIKNIYEILDEFQQLYFKKHPVWDNDITNLIQSINLWDVVQKNNAIQLIDYLLANYKTEIEKNLPANYYFKFGQGYSNGSAIIDFTLTNNKTSMGVQIQGQQFRLFVYKHQPNICTYLFTEFLNYGWFDNSFSKSNKRIFGNNTKMSPRSKGNKDNIDNLYNKYEMSDTSFVYQYFDINDTNNTYEIISELVFNFLNKAKFILENYSA